MLGNVALDVVIGLVFVYLLYSLYATILMEIISSSLGLRARNLCYAISRMLKDEVKYNKPYKRKLSRLLTSVMQIAGKSNNLTNHGLYNNFFEQPSIKYLCNGGVSNKPSYLTAENFSKGVIDAIKISDPDISMLGCIEQGLEKLPENSETRKHIQSLLQDANNDLAKFNLLLQRWYNDTMERATGWFKRSTQIILVMIGFVLAIAFNVDTLAIIKKLSKDEGARNQLVQMATDFIDKNPNTPIGIVNKTDSSATPQSTSEELEALRAARESLQDDIRNSQSVLASDWNINSLLHYTTTRIPDSKDSTQLTCTIENNITVYATVHRSVDLNVLRKVLPTKLIDGKLKISPLKYKLYYVFLGGHLGGYLLTVLALSLGAPFWFDLLNKLVKLRTSKSIAPESDQKSGNASNPAASNRSILNRVG